MEIRYTECRGWGRDVTESKNIKNKEKYKIGEKGKNGCES